MVKILRTPDYNDWWCDMSMLCESCETQFQLEYGDQPTFDDRQVSMPCPTCGAMTTHLRVVYDDDDRGGVEHGR